MAETFCGIEHRPKQAGVLLLGPFMPASTRNRLHRLASEKKDLRILDFVVDPLGLVRDADCVITMGGHNSVSEALSFDRPSLIVPRVAPRREQWVRAHKLAKLGLVDVCDPEDLSPRRLESWIEKVRNGSRRLQTGSTLDMGGLDRVREIVEGLGHRRRRSPEGGSLWAR
ncbi:MAG TPA: hypothetical protein ENI85_18995 [Deltaproteobacteria bacterium]|nr:hypothetical protein [Deltaproteobacteria bacterium]